MIELTCSICGECFYSDKGDINSDKFTVTKKFKEHLKTAHSITIEQYILQTYYNNEYPKCKCGCGKTLKFYSKNALYSENHGFGKYYHCSHVNIGEIIKNKKINNEYKTKYDDLDWCKKHYEEQYGWDNIENALKDYKTRTYAKTDIYNKYKIDFRTLKGIWLKFNLITSDELTDIVKHNQFKLSAKHRRIFFDEKSSIILTELYEILKKFPQKFSISSLINFYNETNIKPIEYDQCILLSELINQYGEEIYELILFGYHSKEELEFINVLKFYFGKSKIIIGKSIQYGKNKTESFIYDVCIDNKIIIEYDGKGYYHPEINKERDLKKENYAIDKGYKFIRISLKSAKNPLTILQIKNMLC